jgi:2-methylcitrate dehydratase PrpD
VQFPIGHPRRRKEAAPMLRTKLEASLARRFPRQRCERILALCDDARRLDRTPVSEFVDLLVM